MPRPIRLLLILALLANVLGVSIAAASPAAQTSSPVDPEVARILVGLTPEQRVGQLFLVTFNGATVDESSHIYELITKYHLGGVALLPANDNFADVGAFATQVRTLTGALQGVAAQPGAAPSPATETPSLAPKQYIPLFIAASYDDDGYGSNTFLPGLSGLTPLPSAMALGATWNPDNAKTSGQIVGQELSALGINMLFGPTLDVVETPQPTSAADLGARAFGGDPYWVGQMGRAFIEGVHSGSGSRMAVVARHFPGYGASDRALADQVPTVSKSLAQLTAIDLAPFFAVTAPDPNNPLVNTDAVLVSHIRYRGFQGNIRDTTKPISFDQQALGVLLGLPDFAAWRSQGGVMVSDALGLRGVRRFYDVTGRTFPAFNIARDAFLAGNDVLYLSQFGATPDADQTDTVKAVMTRFVQKYEEDPAFALRVDDAVARILKLKLRLYGKFTLDAVKPTTGPEVLGSHTANTFNGTRDAATLISPTGPELADRLPVPPGPRNKIAFFTDARTVHQCSTCTAYPTMAVDGLQQAVLRLYGPQGTREVAGANLSSFSFADLSNFLDGQPPPPTAVAPTAVEGAATATAAPAPPAVGDVVAQADWLVFAMQDVKSGVAASNALNRLLAERPDFIRGRKVIVFAFDAPYYLDTTEVAQLTAYYALYSKTPQAVEVAARILFQEISPVGASPVSVPATGYNLIEVTQPDPDQVIPLFTDAEPAEGATAVPNVTPTAPAFAVNNVVMLRTGVIVDRNGRKVPDGTPVKFMVTHLAEGLTGVLADTTTVDGVARASLRLDRTGLVEVSVTSEPALSSYQLQFNAQEAPSTPIVITPTLGATDTPFPTHTPEATATPPSTPVPPLQPEARRVSTADLLTALFALAVLGGAGWRLTNSRGQAVSSGVKLVLVIALAIWAAYDYYALGFPGAGALELLGNAAAPMVIWSGGLVGFVAGWVWFNKPGR
ncbi:MAG: hypothetical protein HY872_03045 [Chloroflexi bacterium]|nr:hypothetical protein [Chloroflexota bacterium]